MPTKGNRHSNGCWRTIFSKSCGDPNAYAMIQRRARAADTTTKIGNHTFRATGVTAYLKNGGTF